MNPSLNKDNLKVSIITVCYNAEEYIENAIQSVLNQTHKDIEYIIIDGKSTDRTLEIVGKYKDRIHAIISEKDNGVYNAMNKGIRNSTGDILYFLNSDDYFFDNVTVETIVKEFVEDNSSDLIYGRVKVINIPAQIQSQGNNFSINLGFNSKRELIQNHVCHQCIFVKKEVFNKFGLFNEKYKIFADFDWILRIYSRGVKIKFINRYVTFYNYQGLNYERRYMEGLYERYYVVSRHCSLYDFLWYAQDKLLKMINNTLLSKLSISSKK